MHSSYFYISGNAEGNIIETPGEKVIGLFLAARKVTNLPSGALGLKERLLFCLLRSPKPPRELMESLCMAKTNLALLAKKCIEEGLIVKTKQSGDRRMLHYALTEQGRKSIEDRIAQINEKFATVLPDDNARQTALATLDAANELLSFVP